jgi:hypothetical protein
MKRLLIFLFMAVPVLAQHNVAKVRIGLHDDWNADPQTNTFCAANLNCTITGIWTFSTTPVIAGFNGIIYIDGVLYPRTNTGVQAALTAAGAQGGGTVYLTLGSYSALTTTLIVPANTYLKLDGTVSLSSSASPAVLLNGQNASLSSEGMFSGSITETAAGAHTVQLAANCNGCKIQDIRLLGSGSAGNTIQILDNQRHISVRNVGLNPIGSCVNYVPGASGFNFILFDHVNCGGFTGVGYNFNLTSGNGTNLEFRNVYANGSGGTPTIGYDIANVDAMFNTAAGNNSPIEWRLCTSQGSPRGGVTILNYDSENSTTAGIQVNGACPVHIAHGLHVSEATPIQVQAAGANTWIEWPNTSGTTGANSITYSVASTGHHICIGCTTADNLDKAISINAAVTVTQLNPTQIIGPQLTSCGAPSFSFNADAATGLGNIGAGSGMVVCRNGSEFWGFESTGTLNQLTLEGSHLAWSSVAGVRGNSADNFLRRTGPGTLSYGTTPSNANGALTLGTVLPGLVGSNDIGAAATPWTNLWLGTAATNNFKFQPAATAAARVVTLPDPGGAVNLQFRSGSTTTGDSVKFDANGNLVDSGAPPVGFTCVNVVPVTTTGGSTTNDQNIQSCTIPAGTLNGVGKTLMIQTAGVYSTPAASTTAVNIKVKLCSVAGCGSGNVATLLSISSAALGAIQATNDPFNIAGMASTQTSGVTSAAEAHGNLTIDISALATAAEGVYADGNTGTVAGSPSAIDLTAQNFLQISVAFTSASASNVATGRQLVVDVVD